MSTAGILYLIPIPIAEGALQTLAPEVGTITLGLKHYVVENTRTARRFLRSLHAALVIEELQFSEIDKHSGPDLSTLKNWLKVGHNVGLMSEAGCPGIADPGADIVAAAHSVGAKIIPLTGPNSLILALMASGLNGQSFAFNGYLPVKEPQRGLQIKNLEQRSKKENQTQLFIETPYRNNNLVDDFLKYCQPGTRLCIAQNISAANAYIRTQTIADWKKNKPVLEKEPAVFLLLA